MLCVSRIPLPSLLGASRPIPSFSISRDWKQLWGNSTPSTLWHQIILRLFLRLSDHLRITLLKYLFASDFLCIHNFSMPCTSVAHITFLYTTYLLLQTSPRIHAFGVKAAVVWTPLLSLSGAKVNNRRSYTFTPPTPLNFHGVTLNYAKGQHYFYVYTSAIYRLLESVWFN